MVFKIGLLWLIKLVFISGLLIGCGQRGPLKMPLDTSQPDASQQKAPKPNEEQPDKEQADESTAQTHDTMLDP